jgi:alpha-L-rhamnosidase
MTLPSARERGRRVAASIAFAAALAAVAAPATAGASGCRHPAPGAERLSCDPVEESQAWRDHVVHVEGPFVPPESVSTEGRAGEIANPGGVVRESGAAATLTTTGRHSATLVIDLGRLAMGKVEVGVDQAQGAPIRVSYAQFRQFLGPDGDGVCCSFGTDDDPESRVDVFDPPAGPAVLESPGKRETRYIALTLDGPGTATIDYVRVRQTIYPVRYDGSFLSSDELLNRAWYASAYTGDLASMRQGGSPWMLTVTFDRVLFMGDLHMQALAGYNQSSDYWMLMRNTLQQFGCVQNPDGSLPLASSTLVTCKPGDPGPPDGWRWPEEGPDPHVVLGNAGPFSLYDDIPIDSFTAFWVAALADYYRYTGDAAFVRPLLPVARRAIGFLDGRTTADGLYYEPHDEFSFRSNWHPGDTATGVDSFSNAAYHDALKGLALLEADIERRPAAAADLTRRAERVRRALVDHLWDPQAGAMILNDEDPRRDHTGDANAGNLMFETLDPARAREVMAFLGSPAMTTPFGTRSSEYDDNPYMQSYIHGYINSQEALGRVRYGDGDGAVDLIRRWWGHMLENGPGTGWFVANNDGSVERGYFANTAWTTALPALSEGVLGIRPAAAGFARWTVAPQPSGLRWAQGRVPVPGGSLASRWEHTERGFVLTVDSSARGRGEVAVPLLGAAREIAMDGRIVWRDERPARGAKAVRRGDAVVFSHVRGDHTFAWGT